MQLSARNQDGLEPGVEARLLDHDGHLTLLASRIPKCTAG